MADEKPPMPPQPPTVNLPAVQVPKNQLDALLLEVRASREESKAGFDKVNDRFDNVERNVEILKNDGQDTKARLGRMERWKDEVDGTLARHSGGAKELAEKSEKLSSADLEAQAKLAQALVALDEERSKRAELEERAVTKDDVAAIEQKLVSKDDVAEMLKQATTSLEQKSVSKEQVEQMLSETTSAQTTALVGAFDTAFQAAKKSPLVQKIWWAIAFLILQALATATAWVAAKGHSHESDKSAPAPDHSLVRPGVDRALPQ